MTSKPGLAYGMRVLQIDHARERTHRQIMRLQYQAGDRTAALRQYLRCRLALSEELALNPPRQRKCSTSKFALIGCSNPVNRLRCRHEHRSVSPRSARRPGRRPEVAGDYLVRHTARHRRRHPAPGGCAEPSSIMLPSSFLAISSPDSACRSVLKAHLIPGRWPV